MGLLDWWSDTLKRLTIIFACAGLSGCGAGITTASPPLAVITPAPITTGPGGSGLGGSVLSTSTNGLPVTSVTHSGGTPFGSVVKTANGGSSFGFARDPGATATEFNVVAFSDDGKLSQGAANIVSATIIGSSTGFGAGFGQRAIYSRDTPSLLPTSGGATFTGEYYGTIGADGVSYNAGTAGALAVVTGAASLTANFGSSNITTGSITGRTLVQTSGAAGAAMPNATVNLGSSAINANGLFAGSATGGAYSGTYKGLIGGTNGTGMAGALSIIDGPFTEVGVFTAQRP